MCEKVKCEFVKLVWLGSRSKQVRKFKIDPDSTLEAFKQHLFINYHGVDWSVDEEEFTQTHYIMMAASGTILRDVSRTWREKLPGIIPI